MQARDPASSAVPAHGLQRFEDLFGESSAMRALYDEIARVAPTAATVLVIGESGSGKELVARAVHRRSLRGSQAFIAVNCGAIPRALLEAELFGHERGSFTGAHQQHAGYFERAAGGTLFLDEITEMAPDMQVRLLRVLETGRFHRVGGTTPVDADVRIVAATNRDPQDAVARGSFREDLLYRLAVFPMRVPPLRERTGDARRLAEHFLEQLAARAGTRKRFTRRALEVLTRHAWPGNVRELRNAVQRAFILCGEDVELPDPTARARHRPVVRHRGVEVWIGTPLADAQRELILATLAHFEGDKPRAAAALRISLKTLYNRLESYLSVPSPSKAPASTAPDAPVVVE